MEGSMFPEYVMKYKKPGFKIIQKGEQYYLYKSTSKRVEGFKNPQAVNTYIGIITEDGLVKAKTRIDDVVSYEYGLCSYLLQVGKKVFQGYGERAIIKSILITIYGIKITENYFKRSYLSILYPKFKFDRILDVDRELARKLVGCIHYDSYHHLIGVNAILINNRWYITNLDEAVIEVLKQYNICLEL